jgi:putative endonuclease
MSLWRRQRGQRGEELALAHLQGQGYRIQQQNYRCRRGEIDIIAWDGATLVFIEVKTKGQMVFGPPQAMVDNRKQQKIVYAAMTYVQQQAIQGVALRFDVIAVTLGQNGTPEVAHLPAAFSPSEYFSY